MRVKVALASVVALLAACSPPPPGTPVTFATLCDEGNADQRVSLEGYPRLSEGMTMVSDTLTVYLWEEPDRGGESVYTSLKIGTGANQVENIPDDFTDADLKIHINDNQVIGLDNKIRMHGRVLRSESIDEEGVFTCQLFGVDLVEDVPDEA